MLNKCFSQPSNKLFLKTETNDYLYGSLHKRIRKLVSLFKTFNISASDRIILSTTNEVEMSVIFLTALNEEIGVIVVDPDTKLPRMEAIIQKVQPTLIITDENLVNFWNLENNGSYEILAIEDSAPLTIETPRRKYYQASLDEEPESMPKESQDLKTLAYIMFTSGTTSEPKGVTISHQNLQVHLQTLRNVYNLTEESQILNQLLLSHADGLIQGPLLSAFIGCTWHRPFNFSISRVGDLLDYVYKSDISHFIAVPTMLHFIEQHSEGYENCFQNPTLRLIISVSAYLSKSLWDAFEETFNVKLSNVYGLTETVAGSLFCISNNNSYKKYTVGKPIDCSIKIIDGYNKEVISGNEGELCLRGMHTMQGYWQNKERTDEVIKDEWLYTGDIAIEDEDGFVSIIGRKKNTIISGGLNIQPEEITECLLYHKGISEAFAFGVPNEILGEKLVVAVVPNKGFKLIESDILNFCTSGIEKRMLPQKFYILEQLPKGISGKVQIERLKSLCLNTFSNSENKSNLAATLLSIISEIFHRPEDQIDLEGTDFFELGGDSLLAALFIAKIQQAFKVKLQFRDIFKNSNLHALSTLIHKLQFEATSAKTEQSEPIAPEINRLNELDKEYKLVIIANDYYEVRQLCDHLKNSYDCYFIQYPITDKYTENLKQGKKELPTIEEIANEIIELLNNTGIVDEKMILMGFSFGGLIAFEMSSKMIFRKLIKKHQLILLDAVVSDSLYPFLIRYKVKFKRKIDTIRRNLKNKNNFLNEVLLRDKVINGKVLEDNKSIVETHKVFRNYYLGMAKRVINSYNPKPIEDGDVILITSESNEARDENNKFWSEKIKKGLTIINVPGDHMTFLKEPKLSSWVPGLKNIINEKIL